MVRHPGHAPRAVALVAVVLLTAACTQPPATVEAGRVQSLYALFLIAAGLIFVVVAGLIGWNIIRYRARGDETIPVQTHTNLVLEVIWWALPTLLMIGLFVASANVLTTNDARHPGAPLRVRVEGFQWQWRITYLDAKVQLTGVPGSPPELVLPVGETVDFELVSDDVIHAFFVPAFLVKRDMVPGIDNHLELTIDQAGTYTGQCAEFCGLLHDQMLFSIRAVRASDFASWLASHKPAS